MDLSKLHVEASKDWGVFRRFIARNPLTGWWLGVAVGGVLGAMLF